jgi:hypothetical protein
MPTSTPEETFATAREAMASGRWEEFFACLDPGDLRRVARNGLVRLGRDARIAELCREAGVPAEPLAGAKALAARIAEAARSALGGQGPPSDLSALLEAHKKALETITLSAGDLPALTAALERHLRATTGGGSISSTLFVDEELEEVRVEGNRATGRRRRAVRGGEAQSGEGRSGATKGAEGGPTEPIGFQKRKGGWRICLLARP